MRAVTILRITLVTTFAIATLVAQSLPPAPGTLVDVGERRLHVYCTGTGTPPVILESGASSFAIDWALVQPAIARTNHVCSYDRAGYGWSDAAAYDMRGEEAVRTLHTALDRLGEKGPFVLVGQSMGGRFVRLFAHLYPSEVKGMVLVDAEHEDGLFLGVKGKPVPISSLSDEEFDRAWQAPSTPPPPMPEIRLQPAHLRLPADLQAVRLVLQRRLAEAQRSATAESMRATMRSEHAALVTLHRLSATNEHPLQDLPLIVLTRGLDENPRRLQAQQSLARLSTNGRQIVVNDSDHEIHLFQPQWVIEAIHEVSR